jgi:predicted ATPase/DNA-binding CsgD family transcriptional regulator
VVAVAHGTSLSPRHNLPAQPTPLLGREQEVQRVRQQLLAAAPPVRLLTLTGPGGTGKTRLALEVASSLLKVFEDGVFFVDLVPVTDARLVQSAVARTLGLRDTGHRPLFERLLDFLRDRRVLLILDNFEQVAEAAPGLSLLLTACVNLKFLVTSRARLRLRWEHVLPVPPLALPDLERLPAPEALATVPSVALFLHHARAIDPSFSLTEANARGLAELCVRLDGLPLALELAAARVDMLPLQRILGRPLERLPADVGDVPPRHWTMRRAIGWSYDLLTLDERALFRRVAIFPTGCMPEAAAAVCEDAETADASCPVSALSGLRVLERLASLASKSLLRQERQPNGELRFGMLETIRAFALEQLAACGELEQTGRRFRDFFVALAERAEPDLTGPEQGAWMDRLEREHDNIRSAIRWCLERGSAEEGLRLAGALWRFWFTRRHLIEGNRALGELLDLEGSAAVRPETRAKALNGAGNLAQACGDLERAARLHKESLALRQALGDRRGIAISLNSLANVAVERGDYLDARALYEESLALRRDLRDERGIAVALNNLSVIARDQSDWERAAALSVESAALFRELGDRQGVALSLVTLGMAKYHLGCYTEATELHRESLALFGELENKREIAEWLEVLAIMACTHGQPSQAAHLFGAADSALEEIGSSMGPARSARYRRYVAEVRDALGDEAFAAAWAEGRAMPFEDALAAALTAEDRGAGWNGPPGERPGPSSPRVRRSTPSRPTPVNGASGRLTRREQEVAALLARGLTNREIAAELTIAERTAETHVCKILSKLSLTRRAQLTAWAVQHDLQMVRPN